MRVEGIDSLKDTNINCFDDCAQFSLLQS